MTDIASIGGMVGGALTLLGTVAYIFKRRADNEAHRIEIEAKHAQASLDRLARLEAGELMSEKKLEDLRTRATNAEASRERLEWELSMARAQTSDLRADLTNTSSRLTTTSSRVAELEREYRAEQARAEALAEELRELKRALASTGSPSVTPLRPPAPKR